MAGRDSNRRLSAILAADVAEYTVRMERDSDGTVAAWRAARDDVVIPNIDKHAGRIVKHTGDGFLAEFPTVQDAVRCAIAMQEALKSSPLDFRMGVNLGDIIDDGKDIHGEGVNVAARIEALAEPGGINISRSVHEQVRHRLDYRFKDMGEVRVKNVSEPVRVIRILSEGGVATRSFDGQTRKSVPRGLRPALLLVAGAGATAALAAAYVFFGAPGGGTEFPYDGNWRVTVDSLSGCLNNERKTFPILVSKGKIDMKQLVFPKTGTVAPDGAFKIESTEKSGQHLNTITGKISGDSGNGSFTGRKATCTGTATIVRMD